MENRLKLAALVAIAILALGSSALLLYGFVTKDWRLTENIVNLRWFSSDEEEAEEDDRVATHRWEFDLAPGGMVNIRTGGATIQVMRGDGHKAVVEVWLEGEATDSSRYKLTAQLDNPSQLTIFDRAIAGWSTTNPAAVRLVVKLPGGYNNLNITSKGGATAIDGIIGSITAHVTGRDLKVVDVDGEVTLKSIQGNITVERSTIGGTIDAERGMVETNYTDGNLTLTATLGITARNHQGQLSASVAEGPLSAELIGEDVTSRLVTRHGNVTLALLPAARASFDVESSTGTVYASIPFDSTADFVARPNLLTAHLNGGGSPVMIRADGGNALLQFYGEQFATQLPTPLPDTTK
jgi:hypothetical protein